METFFVGREEERTVDMERTIVSVALCVTVVASLWITRAPIVLLCLFWLNVIWRDD